jgi:hypothetical protein
MSRIVVSMRQQLVSNCISVTQSTAATIVLLAVPLLYVIVRKVLTHLSAPIHELPGPKSLSWLTGSLGGVWEPDAQELHLEWTRKYGPVFKYHGSFNVSVTYITGTNQLDHPMFPDGYDPHYGPPSVELCP